MARLLLTLRYDGTAYHGWQVQPNGVTVQQALQDAVQAVTGVRSGITGCSRTDAGVHADMFCCTLDTESSLRGNKLLSALNFHLPADIAVYRVQEVADTFHPRYAAKGKRYIYRIWNGAQRHPVYSRYAVHRNRPLDVQQLNEAAQAYVGTHDFAAFCAAGSDVVDTVRTVHRCTVERQGDLVLFTVEGDGFLYNMVRIMVGTLLEIADGRLSADGIPAVLDSRDRNHAGPTAPAKGLCLQQVFYDTL
ncbi:MAG: tRNA pseudouridine(38-40) synthase TruA [Clostridia bacterium]|nr:tRNA pseudouridine(38-40) synthase TruA [Clostridia bacterium]